MRKIHLILRKKHRWGVFARKNVECKNSCFLSGLHIHVCGRVLKRAKFLLLSLVQSNFTCCPCSLLKRFIMTSNLSRRSRRLQTECKLNEDSDLEEMQAANHSFWTGTYLIGEVSRELHEYRQFGLPNPHR